MAERLGCYGESREILRVHGMGGAYAHQNRILGKTEWQFEGQEIFKKAVHGMATACAEALAKIGKSADDVDLVIPHQANMRIIESVAKKAGVPMERVYVNVQRYGNMSAATVPVALCEALEEGRVKPGALLLMPSFGGGLTFTGHVVRWGQRVTPLGTTDVELPPNNQSALEIVERYRRIAHQRVVTRLSRTNDKARVACASRASWTCAERLAWLSSLGFLSRPFSSPSLLLLFSWLDLSGGTFQTSPHTTFRASCDGHPYPFASSLFCAIHSSAASMSDSCAAVMPGMRPPPASCLTRASSVDDTVLTQVSPRRTLEVNFWDFSSSAMSTPESTDSIVAGRNIARLTISGQNFR